MLLARGWTQGKDDSEPLTMATASLPCAFEPGSLTGLGRSLICEEILTFEFEKNFKGGSDVSWEIQF